MHVFRHPSAAQHKLVMAPTKTMLRFVISLSVHVVQVETALTLAWTNSIQGHVRGKIGGVFAVASSLGNALGPPALSSLLAWSLQASASGRGSKKRLVDYHAVFVVEAILMVVITVLGRKVLTLQSLTVPIETRRGVEYESLSLSSGEDTAPSRGGENLVETRTTSHRVENDGRRWRNPQARLAVE